MCFWGQEKQSIIFQEDGAPNVHEEVDPLHVQAEDRLLAQDDSMSVLIRLFDAGAGASRLQNTKTCFHAGAHKHINDRIGRSLPKLSSGSYGWKNCRKFDGDVPGGERQRQLSGKEEAIRSVD